MSVCWGRVLLLGGEACVMHFRTDLPLDSFTVSVKTPRQKLR